MFDCVLVANRGEIARRVMRTCRELDVRTVAIYSDADVDAPHVADADVAVRVGPAPATESYLDVDAVVHAAVSAGAQAVHPGYGFLSENAAFAQAVMDAGLAWVGPSPDAIRLMGDKAAAKARMRDAGVPVVPGVDATEMDDDELVAACRDEVGFPLLLKAVAGGGGKGMRPVHEESELADAIAAAKREAAAAFGDDRLIVERLITRPQHVEIQVFGDTHGDVVHLFERDCSIQRRHQKIVEETPSPSIDDEMRQAMGRAAVEAARAVDYVGAGTVEFIVEGLAASLDDAHTGEFFFLEMNTRLQVEHPVTELVTGQDLVAWQLQVASGQPLPCAQDELTQTGHAIEVRLYAEDPAAGFLPQTGTVTRYAVPSGPGVRVDSGVEDGTVVPRFYDPMLAKLVVHGEDRDAAVARMRALLARTVLHGVRTNLGHLADVVAHPAFGAGEVDTGFLDRHLPEWAPAPAAEDDLAAVAAVLAHHGARTPSGDPTDPWRRLGPWRVGPAGGTPVRLVDGDVEHRRARPGPGRPAGRHRRRRTGPGRGPRPRPRRRGARDRDHRRHGRAAGGHRRGRAGLGARRRADGPARPPGCDPPRRRVGRRRRRGAGLPHARRRAGGAGRRGRRRHDRPGAPAGRGDEDGAPHHRPRRRHGHGAARRRRGCRGGRGGVGRGDPSRAGERARR